MKRLLRILIGALVIALSGMACAFSAAAPSTPQVVTVVVTAEVPTATPAASATAEPGVTPQPTETSLPSATNSPSETPRPTATTGPQCSVLRRLNFRDGPGTAYPIRAVLDTGAVVVPQGYNPAGVPEGDWAQVQDPQSGRTGWVSAGAEFIQCNIDLTTLPQVAVAPPPTPAAPKVSNKPPDGPTGGDILFKIVMNPDYLMQIQARIDGTANNGDGIDKVKFIIERNGQQVYEETESNAAFCIFKGGEPNCNPWPKRDGRLAWGSNGPLVETGDYLATIQITRDADNSFYSQWTFTFTVDLP